MLKSINEPELIDSPGTGISLPAPKFTSSTSIEEAILNRRSARDYLDKAITLEQLGQLLWAGQGINRPESGKRTAPSAGARYPLEFSVAARDVEGLLAGLYKYIPDGHELMLTTRAALIDRLAEAAVNQDWIADAAAVLVISAVFQRTTSRYGQRGERYVKMDVGIAAQNVYLQAESLGLGTVFVGAFDDDQVHSVLGLPLEERPLCLLPISWPVS